MHEGDPKKAQTKLITISPVSSPASGYRLKMNGIPVPFLLDTGTAVSLLREDTWNQVNTSGVTSQQVLGRWLVSVDGSLLQVLGEAQVDLALTDSHQGSSSVTAVTLSST